MSLFRKKCTDCVHLWINFLVLIVSWSKNFKLSLAFLTKRFNKITKTSLHLLKTSQKSDLFINKWKIDNFETLLKIRTRQKRKIKRSIFCQKTKSRAFKISAVNLSLAIYLHFSITSINIKIHQRSKYSHLFFKIGTRFFYKQRFFQLNLSTFSFQCCLTFTWIDLQMLLA